MVSTCTCGLTWSGYRSVHVDVDDGCDGAPSPVTFAIPEGGPGEPFIEFGLLMAFNVPFTKTGLIDMLDPTDAGGNPCPLTDYPLSCISDQVASVNSANGNGSILFRSDPPPLINGIR